MAEYIVLDTPLELYVDRGGFYRQQITTLRELLDTNRIQYKSADVRPVVHGRWEDVSVRDYTTNINGRMNLSVASMFCPVCKRWHNEVYHYGNPTEMAHYCPNCGADMREER